jgi:hypothetical protein
MYPFYLGLDLHLKRTYVVLMNTEGEVIDERRLPNKEVADYLEEHVPPSPHSPKAKATPWLAHSPAPTSTVENGITNIILQILPHPILLKPRLRLG